MINIKSRKLIGGQDGLTLAEMVVALAISAIVVMGSLVILRFTIFAADENQDKTLASLEVQYVGFWVSEDVMQAQTVTLDYGEIGLDPNDGFPLYIRWDSNEEENTKANMVTFHVEEMEDRFGNTLWRLYRTHDWAIYYADEDEGEVISGGGSLGTALVGEYLVPDETSCEQRDHHEEDPTKFSSSLILEVAADVDRSEASNSYEIYPRAFCDWKANENDPFYEDFKLEF